MLWQLCLETSHCNKVHWIVKKENLKRERGLGYSQNRRQKLSSPFHSHFCTKSTKSLKLSRRPPFPLLKSLLECSGNLFSIFPSVTSPTKTHEKKNIKKERVLRKKVEEDCRSPAGIHASINELSLAAGPPKSPAHRTTCVCVIEKSVLDFLQYIWIIEMNECLSVKESIPFCMCSPCNIHYYEAVACCRKRITNASVLLWKHKHKIIKLQWVSIQHWIYYSLYRSTFKDISYFVITQTQIHQPQKMYCTFDT